MKKLLRIQEIDLEIDKLGAKCDKVPVAIDDLAKNLEYHTKREKELHEELLAHKADLAAAEGDIETKKEQIAKYEVQLYSIKKNDEYQALLKEIAGLEKKIDEQENTVLECMDKIDAHVEKEKTAQADRAEADRRNSVERAELTVHLEEMKSAIRTLEDERKPLEEDVDSVLYKQYMRIRKLSLDGRGMAEMVHDCCTGCNMQIRAQTVNEIIGRLDVIACENCLRILYCVDDYLEIA